MSARHVLSVATAALALAALTACSSTGTPAPAPAPAAPATSAAPGDPAAPAPGGTDPAADATAAHQGTAALSGLAALGQEKGSTDEVRGLAGRIAAAATALDEQVRAVAAASGVTLSDALTADQQAVLADLQARSGAPFDQAWTRAVLDLQQRLKADAQALLNSPAASEEAKAALRTALANLDALVAELQAASGAAGAGTPSTVDSGTGGQAADLGWPLAALGLLAGGALLLGGAVRVARR
ncbi:MAG: DUF4142 domain-containing protein [Pseudonocardia sp.]